MKRAYAHVSSPRFGEGAKALTDTLIDKMGFQPDEAAQAVEQRKATLPGLDTNGEQHLREQAVELRWGTQAQRDFRRGLNRFIPTHVGNARPWTMTAMTRAVDPHARGERTLRGLRHWPKVGSSPLLRRNASIPEKLAGLVPMIKRNVKIEARLIDDILDLSAVSAGKLNLSTSLVDMNTLVVQVLETLNHDIVAKDFRLTVELSREPAWVMADSVRMQQVLWNVLRNAVKFTPHGGLLQIGTEHKGPDVVATFRDSGIGIDAKSLSKIFVAFEQADLDTYQRFGGLGLGLAIAMGIVISHGGGLEAASDGLGCGATFTLRLPAKLGAQARE